MSMGEKWKQFTSSSQAQKAGGALKKAETGIWRVLEPVGKASNKLAGKMGSESFYPQELAAGEVEKAARILRTFTSHGAKADADPQADVSGGVVGGPPKTEQEVQQSKDKYDAKKTQKVIKKIPAKALQGAVGVAIFTCFRTGFVWSGAGGSGVVVAKLADGSWGPPSGILIHTLGWGLVIGLDIYDVVIILRTPKALKAFQNPKISLGGELSIAAGPVGNGATIDSGLEASPCWSYTKSKGVYAGLQLDGTIVLKRDDANARFYGYDVSVADILSGKVKAPAAATPLLQTLYAAEGRPEVMGTDHIPEGATPGDIELTEGYAKEMEALNDGKAPTATTETGSTSKASGHRVPPPLEPPAYDAAGAPLQTLEKS